jgi:hypothetical protein
VLSAGEARKQAAALARDRARYVKRAARERVRELREAIKQARRRRSQAIVDARAACRAGRAYLRQQMKELRVAQLSRARTEREEARARARAECAAQKEAARSLEPVERARAALTAERRYRRELELLERQARDRRRQILRPSRAERRQESDDEVRANIPPSSRLFGSR